MTRRVALMAVLSMLLAACAGLETDRSDNQKNLFVNTQADARGWFSGVDASLNIYRMHGDCDVDYQDAVKPGDSRVEIGVPAGELAYLVFRFESSTFFANSHSSMSHDVTLNPLVDHIYDVDVTYLDNIYNVEVQERLRGGTSRQQMLLGSRDVNCDTSSQESNLTPSSWRVPRQANDNCGTFGCEECAPRQSDVAVDVGAHCSAVGRQCRFAATALGI